MACLRFLGSFIEDLPMQIFLHQHMELRRYFPYDLQGVIMKRYIQMKRQTYFIDQSYMCGIY